MEILDVAGQAPDLPRERRKERSSKLRIAVDEAQELVAVEDERLRRFDRDDRRRVRGAVEDGQLAEELARAEDGHDRWLGALVRREDDLDRAACDDEQRIPRIALVEDGLALPKAPDSQGGREGVNGGIVPLAEEAACPQGILGHRAARQRHPHRLPANPCRGIVRGQTRP